MTDPRMPRLAAALVAGVGAATIAGALASEHLYGLVPCKLCLVERQPYYVGVPLAVAALLLPARGPWRRIALALLALVFLVSAGLGAYHAGAEWGFWPGPSDCGGGAANAADVGGFLRQLESVKIVSCTEAAWRFLGTSLAGWNAVVSAGLALIAVVGLSRPRPPARSTGAPVP